MHTHVPEASEGKGTGLVSATMLGIVGLPLIVHAGHDGSLPVWAYQAGLAAAVALGTVTILKTGGAVRLMAILATLLLASLCLIQMEAAGRTSASSPKVDGPHATYPSEKTKKAPPKTGREAIQMTEEKQ